MNTVISIDHVSIKFNLSKDRVDSLKEYIIRFFKRTLFYDEFWALKDISLDIKKGEVCPFLHNKECTVYSHRPIICRVHGLAYLIKKNVVKLPYCTNLNKNYTDLYKNEEFIGNPIEENLDTSEVLKIFDFGVIKNLYDWFLNS